LGGEWGDGSSFHSGIEFGRRRAGEGSSGGRKVFGGEEEGGGVRSGPGAAGTILLFHTISARPSKQPRMVGSILGVYSFGLILFMQEQIKDIIISFLTKLSTKYATFHTPFTRVVYKIRLTD
jgi:hypothetical protein